MSASRAIESSGALSWCAAILLAATATAFMLTAIDLPLGVHPDEPRKVQFVLTGLPNFQHPVLMIQLGRIANAIAGLTEPQALIELCRALSAVTGGILVFATWMLARTARLPLIVALAAAAAVAVTPLFTSSALFFKEDIFLTPALLFGLVALIRYVEKPDTGRAVLLGLCCGLACAAKYVGAALIPYSIAVALLAPVVRADIDRPSWKHFATTLLTAIAVFLVINSPTLFQPGQFRLGFSIEAQRSVAGQHVPLPITLTAGVFHLRESLLPAIGIPLLALGLSGLFVPFVAARERQMPLAVVAGFALLWYAIHELTPLKVYPNYHRYMLPVAPLLVILAAGLVYEVTARLTRSAADAVSAALIVAAAVPALIASSQILGAAKQDPRVAIAAVFTDPSERIAMDSYATFADRRSPIALREPLPTGVTHDLLVTSNLAYDRFTRHATHPRRRVRTAAAYYEDVFRMPYLEVTNGAPNFGFLNPVQRIVALDGNAERLAPVAAVLARLAPPLQMRIVHPPLNRAIATTGD